MRNGEVRDVQLKALNNRPGARQMTPNHTYQRDEKLRQRINAFLQNAFQLPSDDYYGKLDLKSLLGMKSALSDINNALTMQLTLGFVDWVVAALSLDMDASTSLRADVLRCKPSSNGYDVQSSAPLPLIAEVKCNVPINGGTKYGAAQKAGILNDINALLQGKSKASPTDTDALKFMVFLDLPEVRAANEHLIASNGKLSKAFRILKAREVPSDPAVVYGVYATFGATQPATISDEADSSRATHAR
jgi:hypothetical protein